MNLVPSIGIDETYYGESQAQRRRPRSNWATPVYHVVEYQPGAERARFLAGPDFPSAGARVPKKTIFGDKLKHVIEPRAAYRYVTGVDRYQTANGTANDFNRFSASTKPTCSPTPASWIFR